MCARVCAVAILAQPSHCTRCLPAFVSSAGAAMPLHHLQQAACAQVGRAALDALNAQHKVARRIRSYNAAERLGDSLMPKAAADDGGT